MSERLPPRLLISFYGDDFTGSADAMEALSLGGARCVLFLEPPPPEQLRERFADLRAVGVAGASRTMTPGQMEAALPDVFARIKRLNAAIFHYKVCSTFDSSPEVGSVGCAMGIGRRVFHARFVPLLVGAPVLKRYCLFGNLFATGKAVGGEETFRLDRHPVMSRHPVTPMRESDLRVHLGAQAAEKIALFDILKLTGSRAEVDANFARVLEGKPDAVLFDVLDDERLTEAGRLIWSACGDSTLFVIGSSGVEYALAAHWRESGVIAATPFYPPVGEVDKLIVVSGSCSPVTKGQIEWASRNGFTAIELNAIKLTDGSEAERDKVRRKALAALSQGRSVMLYSAKGPEDPHIAATMAEFKARGMGELTARARLGEQQGILLRELLAATKLRRACVAGGDTSSHAIRQLGIYALELCAPLAPGSPLCRAYSHDAALDGVEIAMKGGQRGEPDYFGSVRRGTIQ
jgi:3-oxoisoapionate kinase